MPRKLRPALDLVSDIGSLGFDLQHHSDEQIAEAVRILRTVNPEMFDWIVKQLAAQAYPSTEARVLTDKRVAAQASPPTAPNVFDELKALKQDWDTYGAAPLDPAVVDSAELFWRRVSVVPGGDGSVQLEWHTHGWDIEIEFNPDGTTSAYLEPAASPPTADAEKQS